MKKAWIVVNLVQDCLLIIDCFVIEGNTTTQLPSHFSKTGFLRRSLIVRLIVPAKTTPTKVFPEHILRLLLFKLLVQVSFKNSLPLSASIKTGFFFNSEMYFQ